MNLFLKNGSKSFNFVWFTAVLFFVFCVIFPLGCVIFTPSATDFASVFSSEILRSAMRNTLVECVCSTLLSVAIGYVYAYAVVRGNIPFKKFFAAIPIIHLVTPPFVGGLAFILLLGKQGFITKTLLNLDVSLYGFAGLLIAQVLCFFPVAYLICLESIRGINPSLEQAARGMGAGDFRVFFTVTLPLSFSGIMSSLLFIAVSVLSDFGNPLIVAGRFRVLAVEIYTQLTGWLNSGKSAALGLILLLPSVALFIIQHRILKKNVLKIATIGGKTSCASYKKTSLPVSILLTAFCLFFALAIIFQFASIVAGSFQNLWGINTAFTLDHIKAMTRYLGELKDSVLFAFIAAIFATLIALVNSYIVHRTESPLRPFLDIVCQIPSAIPGSLFGLSIALAGNLLQFREPHILIVVAMTVGFLPFSYRIITAGFAQLKTTLDDGARSLGAGRLKVLSSILAPLLRGGIFSSFIYVFARGTGTLSSVIFLVSFNTPLASVAILNLAEQGDWGKSAALALILTILTFFILGIGRFLVKRYSIIEGSKKSHKAIFRTFQKNAE